MANNTITEKMASKSIIYGIGDEFLITAICVSIISPILIYIAYANRRRSWFARLFSNNPNVQPAREGGNDEDDAPHMFNSTQYCPICLNAQRLSMETNCGHVYCGVCLQLLYNHEHFGPIRCPICRQQVMMLFLCFTEEERAADTNSEIGVIRDDLYRLATLYNRRHSGRPRSIADRMRDLPTLLRHLWHEVFTIGGIVRFRLRLRIGICLVAGVLYLFLPHDIIPETMFGLLGLIDDVLVIFFIVIYLATVYRSHVLARNVEEPRGL